MHLIKLYIIALVCLCPIGGLSQNLILDISGIRTDEGHIQLMFYTKAENFDQDTPDLIKRYSKQGMRNGQMIIKETLKPGLYGVVLMDDVIDSEVMEFNILGFPKKGFGFAGYYHKGIRRPHFSDFSFAVGTTVIRKEIWVRYF